jgi:hypothetical protein
MMNMNVTDDTERQAAALAAYHAKYNNESYRAVQVAVISDLYGEAFAQDVNLREQLLDKAEPNLLMNLLTDSALSICGYPYPQNKRQTLVNAALQYLLSVKTIRLMSQHLENFEEAGSTFSSDFENVALSLLKAGDGRAELVEAVSFSSAIHGVQGRAAHYLLKAALSFIHAAELLLKAEQSQSYLNEKLAQGTSALADAMGEIQQD